MSDEDDISERHPALRDFNRTAFQIKHVARRILTGAAIGAATTTVLGAGVATAIYFVGAPLTIPATIIGGGMTAALNMVWPGVAGEVGSTIASAGWTSLLTVGGIGAAMGALINPLIGDPGAAANAEEERLIAAYERREARQERVSALSQRRDQQYAAMTRQRQGMIGPGQLPLGRGPQERQV